MQPINKEVVDHKELKDPIPRLQSASSVAASSRFCRVWGTSEIETGGGGGRRGSGGRTVSARRGAVSQSVGLPAGLGIAGGAPPPPPPGFPPSQRGLLRQWLRVRVRREVAVFPGSGCCLPCPLGANSAEALEVKLAAPDATPGSGAETDARPVGEPPRRAEGEKASRIRGRGKTVMEYMSTDSDHKQEIDLMLTDLNMSEVIDIMENLYPNGDLAVYEDSLLALCPETNKNEERAESLLFSGREVSSLSSVKYGTVEDLLAFANQVSNTAKQFCRPRRQESGIILNMISPKNGRYQIDSDVLLFPWKLTYRNIGTDFIPRGAFGKVYLAQDTETKKRMACKLVPVEQFKPSDVEIQACFRHENIAELYGAILWDETIHLFMEAGEGGSVLEKVESCGPLREFEIIWVTKHILKGLEFLHSKGVIHQDIKPSNIVFMSTKAVLVDFGLSVQMTEDVFYPKDLRGTEIYMSPEVILCRGHTTKADIYSLGATIIHMQTGIPPWVNRYPRAAYPSYLYIIHKQAPPLEDIAEDCSAGMRRLLEASLERNPNQRPSATELLKHEALHPPPEEQPRCQSLDSALFERKRLLTREELELPENIADSSTLGITEESELLKRQRSLYIDIGALAGYFNIVRGTTTLDYE